MRRMTHALVPLALLVALASPPTASARVDTPDSYPVPTLAHAEDYATAPAILAPVISITTEVQTAYAVPEVGIIPTYVNKASPPYMITDHAAVIGGNEIDMQHRDYMTSTTSNDLAGRLGNMQSRRRPHLTEPTVDSNVA